jgi:hypothetical protein
MLIDTTSKVQFKIYHGGEGHVESSPNDNWYPPKPSNTENNQYGQKPNKCCL